MNIKYILNKTNYLVLLLLSSNLMVAMEDNNSENKKEVTKSRIAIDYSKINWGAFQVFPNDMKKEILDYVFNDIVIDEIEKSLDKVNNKEIEIYNWIRYIDELSNILNNIKVESLIQVYNLKKVNKAFNQFLLKNYSEQLKKISNILGKILIIITHIISQKEDANLDLAKKIIESGVNINFQDSDGETTLMLASQWGNKEIVELLIKAGVNLNLKDRDGETALMNASGEGHIEIVELLIKAGANLNLQDIEGETALMNASGEGHIEIVELLIDAGANLNLQHNDGRTALILAFESDEEEIVELLIKAGKRKRELEENDSQLNKKIKEDNNSKEEE